jgi:hypothetical protein
MDHVWPSQSQRSQSLSAPKYKYRSLSKMAAFLEMFVNVWARHPALSLHVTTPSLEIVISISMSMSASS